MRKQSINFSIHHSSVNHAFSLPAWRELALADRELTPRPVATSFSIQNPLSRLAFDAGVAGPLPYLLWRL